MVKVSLLTASPVVREDGQFLYGFSSESERFAFRQLIKISGVGARMALAVLSGLSVSDLAQAIARQEAGDRVKVPGIGKKTAERLLLELTNWLTHCRPPHSPSPTASMTFSMRCWHRTMTVKLLRR